MIERYTSEMTRAEELIRKKIVWRGLVNSLQQCIGFFAYAGVLYYSSYLIAAQEIHFKNVIKLVKIALHLHSEYFDSKTNVLFIFFSS